METRLKSELRTQKDLEEARTGMLAHAIVYTVVSALLVAVNVTFVPQFLWFGFLLAGMGIGLVTHYLFGVYLVERRAKLAL
jgi:uncharacterized protein YqfA (UPF0365 family)